MSVNISVRGMHMASLHNTTVAAAQLIIIQQDTNESVHSLLSVQGNCTAQFAEQLDPRRKPSTQCVITVREDFLEVPTDLAQVWISDLYVRIRVPPAQRYKFSTLIGVHGGDVYLTDMSFVGDGDKCRAIDVKEKRKLYVSSKQPSPLPLCVLSTSSSTMPAGAGSKCHSPCCCCAVLVNLADCCFMSMHLQAVSLPLPLVACKRRLICLDSLYHTEVNALPGCGMVSD
jgi:hypothetical protein